MEALFSIEALGTLATLIFLQAVLGFDNLLYISIESQRAPAEKQSAVRKWGIAIAVALRLVLLFLVMRLLSSFVTTLFSIDTAWVKGEFDLKAIIFLFGGGFIMYTAVKEINHLLSIDDHAHESEKKGKKSVVSVIALIVFMNLIFSFDSILSMLPLTTQFAGDELFSNQFWLMAVAAITSGVLMILLADKVTEFIKKNRMFEVLGLFILLIVGVMLLAEGGHIAHLEFFGYKVEAMSKSTFYFSVVVLVIVDVIQTRYQRKLRARAQAEIADPTTNAPAAPYVATGATPPPPAGTPAE